MKNNTGEAILILGAIYLFTIIDGWTKWLLLVLIAMALATWSINIGDGEQKEFLKLSVEKIRLEIELMKAQTAFYIAQGAAIMRNLRK